MPFSSAMSRRCVTFPCSMPMCSDDSSCRCYAVHDTRQQGRSRACLLALGIRFHRKRASSLHATRREVSW